MTERKIISWNINGIRTRIKNKDINSIFDLSPDLLLIQETKAEFNQIDKKFIDSIDYEPYFLKGESSRSGGSVTFVKNEIKPNLVKNYFEESKDSLQGRFLNFKFKDFNLIHVYGPTGTGVKSNLKAKLDFFNKLLKLAEELANKNVIIIGDFNIAHNEIDVSDNSIKNTFLKEEREILDKLESLGYIDSFRHLNNNLKEFSSWKSNEARENNEGTRLDYAFVSKSLSDKLISSKILSEINCSKHSPIELIINI